MKRQYNLLFSLIVGLILIWRMAVARYTRQAAHMGEKKMVAWFPLQAITLVMLAMVSLSVLLGCQTARTLTVPGESVSSGEFYDMVVRHYTVVLPPLIETGNAEKLMSSLPIDRARFKVIHEDGQIFDYTSQIKHTQEFFNQSLSRGTLWDVSIKIQKVAMTDTTHGAVLWLLINDWENADRTRSGRFQRRSVSHWEKIDGQWRVVATHQGRSF